MSLNGFADEALSVSDFAALVNQTLEFAYPMVTIVGELANFKVNRNIWVYFDLKDEGATIKCFCSVQQLKVPLENGMMLKIRGKPRLHPKYGFSVNVSDIQPVGEGSIKRAANLLFDKLSAEGLFAEDRKRPLPYPPSVIGLVASKESAAYADFVKILHERWRGVTVLTTDVLVQGDDAPGQIVEAIKRFNKLAQPPDVIVITRGGGSPEDLLAFNSEIVTRAVASSQIPTLAAIGHEIDVCLAELAADVRASTPTNAAEKLVPDRVEALRHLENDKVRLVEATSNRFDLERAVLADSGATLRSSLLSILRRARTEISSYCQLLGSLNPVNILSRGYAVVRKDGKAIVTVDEVSAGDMLNIELSDGKFNARTL